MTRAELEKMTKDELIDYADDNDIEVQHSWLKDDIVKEILKGQAQDEINQRRSKAVHEFPAAPAAQSAEPATADELADATAALVRWMEAAGHRDHALVIKAKTLLDGFK